MHLKRRLSLDDNDGDNDVYDYGYDNYSRDDNADAGPSRGPAKRIRIAEPVAASPPSRNIISTLPAELLVRVFSYLNETTLLDISTVSQLFRRVASDGQLWRVHYYRRFIVPRAHLIPGFRRAKTGGKLGGGKDTSSAANLYVRRENSLPGRVGKDCESHPGTNVDWLKYYKLKHNWSRGRCSVDELRSRRRDPVTSGKTLVKVVEGLAVTADSISGLMVWDLRTRASIAQADLDSRQNMHSRPTCIAVDDEYLQDGKLGITVGFKDGSFGVWRVDVPARELVRLCRPNQACLGGLLSVAYAYPYLLAASRGGAITLWTLEPGEGKAASLMTARGLDRQNGSTPRLLRSLRSQTTRVPVTLSIRRTSYSIVASIVYTIDTLDGWSIGIQDLDIHPSANPCPDIVHSRVATTVPKESSGASSTCTPGGSACPTHSYNSCSPDGPIRLCYNHPYLLATLPDNTLMLHLCTSTPDSLSISPGTRLWGHTSGISDAEITARGKAVSVSARGDEIRVWELEGRMGGNSVEVRPREEDQQDESAAEPKAIKASEDDYRRNKVGFDDEMVIVLKETLDGRESLMVYDFT